MDLIESGGISRRANVAEQGHDRRYNHYDYGDTTQRRYTTTGAAAEARLPVPARSVDLATVVVAVVVVGSGAGKGA